MRRRSFIKNTGILTMSYLTGLNTLSALANATEPTAKMPVLFIGHGNPMNAIEPNEFNKKWHEVGQSLPRPKAILSISAHWLTSQTSVTAMAHPRTIHDFGGFPKKLFDQQYPAPGSPQLAQITAGLFGHEKVLSDESWGLDHGTWSVLLPMYPAADIPVYQLSIVYDKPLSYHFELGKQLASLRERGVLIIGSGNLVHNLGQINWTGDGNVYDWALRFDSQFKNWMDDGDTASLLKYQSIMGSTAAMAHPTNDHLLPLYYVLGLQQKGEKITYFNEQFDMGSISMRSLMIS